MSTFGNQDAVANQVGGDQNVHGSIYNGNVTFAMQVPMEDAVSTNRQPKADYRDVLNSLSFPSMLDRRNDIEQPYKNTCRWIYDLKEYQAWKAQEYGLLWIKGKPGAGKSTLMSFLYNEELSERLEHTIYIGFFFSARGVELQRTPLGMLRSLLSQLLSRDDNVRRIVTEVYEEKMKSLGNTADRMRTWEWQRRELETLLLQTIIKSSQRQRIHIFVDALDEAGEVSAREIAQYLHLLYDRVANTSGSQSPSIVKICLSCRHYPIVSSVPGEEIQVEQHNSSDIATFIHNRLRASQMLLDDDDRDGWIKLEKEVTNHAQGSFQWARLIVPVLEKCLDEAEPLKNVQQLLYQVPQELDDVYEFILKNVISPQNRPQSYRLFQWVCFALRPLSVSEIRYALVTQDSAQRSETHLRQDERSRTFVKSDSSMRRRINALSGGLIEVSDSVHGTIHDTYGQPVERVQVIHQSVNDFLKRQGLALILDLRNRTEPLSLTGGQLSISTPSKDDLTSQSHSDLYWSCLNHLVEEIHQKKLAMPLEITVQNLGNRSPLASYVFWNILHHAEKAGQHRSSHIAVEMDLWREVTQYGEHRSYLHDGIKDWHFLRPGTTLLHIAAAGNLVDILQRLIKDGFDPDVRTADNTTPLHVAAQYMHQPVAQILVAAGANIYAKGRRQLTPLAIAPNLGWATFLEHLPWQHVYPHRDTSDLIDAFCVACSNGHDAIVKMLLKAGVDANSMVSGRPAIHTAAGLAMDPNLVLRNLVDAGADVNNTFDRAPPPLHHACSVLNKSGVSILIAAGANVNAQSYVRDVLVSAWRYRSTNDDDVKLILRLLLQNGANVKDQPNTSPTALQLVMLQGTWRNWSIDCLMELSRLLIAAGADVDANPYFTMDTPLYMAAQNGWHEVVKLFLNAKADVDAQGGMYGSALHGVVQRTVLRAGSPSPRSDERAYSHVLSALLGAGAGVDKAGRYGTALQTAAWAAYWPYGAPHSDTEQSLVPVIMALLAAGADVDLRRSRYGTALQAFTALRSKRVVKILLDSDADPDLAGGDYPSARTIALRSGDDDLVQLFIKDEKGKRMC